MADSIAEMFFLIALDEISGRQRIRTELLYSGVAAGVFADLALRRLIAVDDAGLVRPGSAGDADADGGADAYVVEAVARQESVLSVHRWIEEIGSVVVELVYRGLADAAVIRRDHVGGLHRHEVYPAVNLVAAATPRLELARMLVDPRLFNLTFGVTAVLVDVAGLGASFSADRHESMIREIMEELADNLPGDLRAITSAARTAAVHRAVLPQ